MTTAMQRSPAPGVVGMDQWQIMRQQADMLVKSGFLPTNINTPEKAVAVILKGQELGIPAMYALSNIIISNGKTTCSAELMLALIYRDHGDQAVLFEESTPDRCVVTYARRGWLVRKTHSFTMREAEKAELPTGRNAGTWGKYPAQMLRARCISAVARLAFPDSIAGMYTPEELDAAVQVDDVTGEITVQAVEIPNPPMQAQNPIPAESGVPSIGAQAPKAAAGTTEAHRGNQGQPLTADDYRKRIKELIAPLGNPPAQADLVSMLLANEGTGQTVDALLQALDMPALRQLGMQIKGLNLKTPDDLDEWFNRQVADSMPVAS